MATATISILAAPVLSVSGSPTICTGQKVTYTASGASTYTWSSGQQSAAITITPATSGVLNYTITGTSSNGCKNKTVKTITVDKCTGIEETEIAGKKIIIYPNPNTGEFTIEGAAEIVLSLFSGTGQLIKSIALHADNLYRASVSGLAPGVYLLSDSNGKNVGHIKVVVGK
jgi:hypothetical protein